MLIFDPETRVASLRESLAFLREYADVPMNFCRTEIYPGTPLKTKLAREGRLIGDVFGWDYEIRDPAAERAFRVFASAFLDRNFRCDGLMNATLGARLPPAPAPALLPARAAPRAARVARSRRSAA